MLYDISYPHDLRLALMKVAMGTAEIDAFLADPANDADIKRKLLADVQPQGYEVHESA